MNLRILIETYKRKNKPDRDKILDYYKGLDPLEKVIEKAALAIRPDGKRDSHQRRIKKKVLEKVKDILLDAINEIDNCHSFEDLIKLVEEKTREVKGFGELAVYDTSLRISAKKDIYPLKVFLHAGTREGCRVLGLNDKLKVLRVQDFPKPIRALQPRDIEAFLCIYRNKLYRANGAQRWQTTDFRAFFKEALIKILVKKGIITEEELLEEVRKVKSKKSTHLT
jgi:hypothetical protein